jgi:hypothetical protein
MTTQFSVYSMLKPSIRKSLTVTLTTTDGKEIAIDLLDGKVVHVDGEVTYVHGKTYDG